MIVAVSKKRKRVGVIPKLILLAFVIYSAVTLVSLQMKINSQRDSVNHLEKQISEEKTKQTQLKQLVDSKVDDSYIIGEAQKQGYAAANERVFVDISGE